jgi:hypothetical protein
MRAPATSILLAVIELVANLQTSDGRRAFKLGVFI